MSCWITLQTGSNFWLTYWSNANDPENSAFYLKIYAALALSFAFFSFARTAIIYSKSVQCSRKVHKDMFNSIIRAPINTFFDRVPLGRLLNRFSKDLSIVDSTLSLSYGILQNTTYWLFSDVFVCFYVGTYWLLPCFAIFFALSYNMQIQSRKIKREVIRLEGISRSPIISLFSETLSGLTTIRGYHDENRFIQVKYFS